MIQELLGGGSATTPNGLFGERKFSIPFPSLSSSSTICPPTTPPVVTTTVSTTNGFATPLTKSNSSNSPNSGNNNNNNSQNLRCPRCDSTNTKFCYYNNYNLTQPRHFCKTCRRYWTKGGTLRNVPIGGGCRKNKGPISSNSSAITSNHAMAKAKATLSTEMLVNDNSLFLGNGLLDNQLQQNGSNPILWSSLPQPQNSNILSLLRGTTPFSNPNPNPTSNIFTGVKTEASTTPTTLGLDSYSNGAPPQVESFTRNNHHHLNGFAPGIADFMQNNGHNASNSNILDLYQRLKSSSSYGYCGSENPGAVILGNMVGSTASSRTNTSSLDAATLAGGGDHSFGGYNFMNPTAMSSWSDLPAVPIHGAYP